jgi:hypothetical protein
MSACHLVARLLRGELPFDARAGRVALPLPGVDLGDKASRGPIRRSRHCPRNTPISISTMLKPINGVIKPDPSGDED